MYRKPIYEKWEKFLDEFKRTAPVGMQNCFQIADYFWALNEGEEAIFQGALQGIVTSVCLAFLILLVSTMNIYVAIYAIISVGFICSNVVAIMVWNGWEMGTMESIAMVVIIGFSVDYVVHLAAHYVHSS